MTLERQRQYRIDHAGDYERETQTSIEYSINTEPRDPSSGVDSYFGSVELGLGSLVRSSLANHGSQISRTFVLLIIKLQRLGNRR